VRAGPYCGKAYLMDWRAKLGGFYAILDRDDPKLADDLLSAASVLQIRLKGAPRADLLRIATWVRRLTAARGALLVVNDDLEAALAAGADAVHLGQEDLPLAEARARVGQRLLIGVSTHDLEQVARAVAGGADYLGFGPVFATGSKADPDPVVGLDGLAAAVRTAAPIPLVAIGGITQARAREVAAAGAHAGCAISAVNQAADVRAAGAAIAGAFSAARTRPA
jgi:thiamine-phosphate pyrophosphorylase